MAQSNCTPSSCKPKCDAGCSANQVCTLGTMKECGVCPASTCVDRSVLGLPPASTTTTSSSASTPTNDNSSTETEQPASSQGNNKGALIGGIVGGLLGGLVIFTAIGCLLIRRYKRKSKNMLPFASNLGVGYSSTTEKTSNVTNTRQVTSGVIPVTYIPPDSNNKRTSTTTTDNNRTSYLNVTDYDSDGESADTRSSMASTADNPTTPSKTGYAIAVSRARPQIMRVNQIQIPSSDGLNRSSSVRTVLTREANLSRSNTAPARRVHKPPTPQPRPLTMLNPEQQQPSSSLAAPDNEDPFHDRHSISVEDLNRPSSSSLQHVDSRTLGDGEITIYWNPEDQQSKR